MLRRLSSRLAGSGRGMEAFGVDEVSFDRRSGRSAFPFELGRQPGAVPIRVGVGLEITEVRDGFRFIRRDENRRG